MPTEELLIEAEDVRLFASQSVTINSQVLDNPVTLPLEVWPERVHTQYLIPGLGEGVLCSQELRPKKLRITRDIFRPAACTSRAALRLTLTNLSEDAICVESLCPLLVGPDGLSLRDAPVSEWVYVRQPRQKNDMPAAIRLGSTGPEVWDALRGTPETGGAPRDGGDAPLPTRFVSADLTLLRGPEVGLLLGQMPLDRQLTQTTLRISGERDRLLGLSIACLCDGQVLPPGETITGQWVLIDADRDAARATERYTCALAASQGYDLSSRKRARPPSVWCSWYYYGDGFSQQEAEQNLEFLRSHPLPIDVFLIDECWDVNWGDWEPNSRWPGIDGIAQRIREAGFRPGIWTCPFLAAPRATLRYYRSHWLLKNRQGEPVRFTMNSSLNYVLDPTHPEVLAFLEELYRRLTHDWGFTYHKLDFTRAVGDPEAVFHDRTASRAQAYRRAMEAVRRGMGAEAYLNVCGGLYGPLIGLVDAQRTGSDVKSLWPPAPPGEEGHGYGPFTIKQNTLRYWMNRFWDNDPDALMVRRRSEPYRGEVLSLGALNDEEALTSSLNQYLGGGLVCFTENLAEIDQDRLQLLRHCVPSTGTAAIPLDLFEGGRFPAVFDTAVVPKAPGLPPWRTISFVNWSDRQSVPELRLDETTLGDLAGRHQAFALTSFRRGWLGRLKTRSRVEVGPIAPHGCEVIRVQPWDDSGPQILGTDGHFSMGGTEVVSWEPDGDGVSLSVLWPWAVPLRLWIRAPRGRRFEDGSEVAELTVPGGGKTQQQLRRVYDPSRA